MADADSKGPDMPRPIINEDECSGCGVCVDTCPSGVIELVGEVAEAVNEDDCTGCEACLEECPMGAITEVEED
jgi:NAD-dependent dihydropyrimidine dehydrogenase PreA subunit